jgi:beta-glucanase (GH16 family)
VSIPNQDWQRWRIVWDRTSGDWRSQSITWFMNDHQFHQVRGDQLNNQGVWESLTAKPLFFILNVAVGGNWVSRHNITLVDSSAGDRLANVVVCSPAIPTATPLAATAP